MPIQIQVIFLIDFMVSLTNTVLLAVAKDLQDQAHPRQKVEAKPPDPTLDSSAYRQHDPIQQQTSSLETHQAKHLSLIFYLCSLDLYHVATHVKLEMQQWPVLDNKILVQCLYCLSINFNFSHFNLGDGDKSLDPSSHQNY